MTVVFQCASNAFSELFYSLETEAEKLDVQSFGVSMTTLEEVFLKIGEEDEGEDENEGEQTGAPRFSANKLRNPGKTPLKKETKI